MRNTRYRAVAAGLTSAGAVVYAELSARFQRQDLRGPRFRERFILRGPRGTRVAARRAHFYLIRAGRRVARHAASHVSAACVPVSTPPPRPCAT